MTNQLVNKIKAAYTNLSPKHRQYLWGMVVVGVIVVMAFGTSWLTGGGKPADNTAASKEKPVRTQIDAPGKPADPQAVWMSQSEGQIKALQKQMQEMLDSQKKLADKQTKTEEERKKAEDALKRARTDSVMPNMPLPPYRGADVRGPGAIGGNIAPANAASFPPPIANPGQGPTTGPHAYAQGQAIRPAGIFTLSLGDEGNAAPAVAAATPRRTSENYIFTGSITQAVLLSGLDAPTGGQAQSQPHPVLMRLTNHSILPSKLRADMRECFVLGSGYGDISSERAYIRTEKLSCKSRDGSVIDMEMKGFVTGSDGRVGIRGRLVTKQGALLMRALISGVASGIGDAFKQQYTTTSISPLGATQTIDKDKVINSGVAGGVSTAMDRLSKYYIDMANKIFPIVEIDPGWPVDIIVTEGFYLADTPVKTTRASQTPGEPTRLPQNPGASAKPIAASVRTQ
jgi:conjugal transfer pilus assembly protein TraB